MWIQSTIHKKAEVYYRLKGPGSEYGRFHRDFLAWTFIMVVATLVEALKRAVWSITNGQWTWTKLRFTANIHSPQDSRFWVGSVKDQLYQAMKGNVTNSRLIPRPDEVDFISTGSPCL